VLLTLPCAAEELAPVDDVNKLDPSNSDQVSGQQNWAGDEQTFPSPAAKAA
jgi:hypothetical protein